MDDLLATPHTRPDLLMDPEVAAQYMALHARLCQALGRHGVTSAQLLGTVLTEIGASFSDARVHSITCQTAEHPYIPGLFSSD